MSALSAYMMTDVGAATGHCYAAMRSCHAPALGAEYPTANNGRRLVIAGV